MSGALLLLPFIAALGATGGVTADAPPDAADAPPPISAAPPPAEGAAAEAEPQLRFLEPWFARWMALDADEREWWDATLTRMHAVAVAAARLPAKVRDRVIHAGDDGDLESAIGAQERALVEETERGAAVFGCDESDLRIVERAEAPDAGF